MQAYKPEKGNLYNVLKNYKKIAPKPEKDLTPLDNCIILIECIRMDTCAVN